MWGCIDENSYLYAYYEAFWQDIMGTFEDIVWKSEKIYKNFFYANEDRFFNNYQDTSPEVDIAEAFSQFIMISKREIDAVKYEKLDYFYQYDE